MTIFEELQARGLIAQITDEQKVRNLINNGEATFYIGFDPTADRVIRTVLEFMPSIGFSVQGLDYSPITGPEGNIEFLLYMRKSDADSVEPDISSLVERAHRELKK